MILEENPQKLDLRVAVITQSVLLVGVKTTTIDMNLTPCNNANNFFFCFPLSFQPSSDLIRDGEQPPFLAFVHQVGDEASIAVKEEVVNTTTENIMRTRSGCGSLIDVGGPKSPSPGQTCRAHCTLCWFV